MYIVVAGVVGILVMVLPYVTRPSRYDLEKTTAFECGFEPFGEARSPFDVGFY